MHENYFIAEWSWNNVTYLVLQMVTLQCHYLAVCEMLLPYTLVLSPLQIQSNMQYQSNYSL